MLRWALATFVKGMKIRLRKNWLLILAEREVPQRRNWRWYGEFTRLIMMDMGLCHEWCVPPLAPTHPTTLILTLSHNMYQNLTITPSNTDTITNTTPNNANKTSTSHLWLKMSCMLTYS